MDNLKILLVKDHAGSRYALRRALELAGFHVVEAATVSEGMAQIDGQHFALLDLHLPDGKGTQVCEAIRKLAPQTKVAFITSAAEPERTIRLMGQCPDAIFSKPIDIQPLLKWLRQG